MRVLHEAPLGAWGLITRACVAVSLLASCNADDVQGPAAVPGGDVDIQALAVPTGGLVGEWKLDGNVNDNTTNNFHATLFGSPPYIGAKIGQGLDLTGNGTGGLGGKYVEMPLSDALNDLSEGSAYSLSAWFIPASAPSGAAPSTFWMVVGKKSAPAIGIIYNANERFAARHLLDGNVVQVTIATTPSALNQWHHVVAVVTKGSSTVPGSLKLYVNGELSNSTTWAGGTPAMDFGTTAKWRIGKAAADWSAHGRVDQVRLYNVAVYQAGVTELFNETARPIFRFPVGMAKEQISDLGTDAFPHNPDGKMNAKGTSMLPILRHAKQNGARVIVNLTGDTEQLFTNETDSVFNKPEWMRLFNNAFAAIPRDTVRAYIRDGTLIGIYVIDEPFQDFKGGFTHETLDELCQHIKSPTRWPWVTCIIRSDNTIVDEHTPDTYTYHYLDAGWSQATEFKVRNRTVRSYYEANLQAGDKLGLGVWYGFNFLRYVSKNVRPNCTPEILPGSCAISPNELDAVTQAIEAIHAAGGVNGIKGCGVSGWYLESASGAARNYFVSNAGIKASLQNLWNRTAGRTMQPGSCNIRGDLPTP